MTTRIKVEVGSTGAVQRNHRLQTTSIMAGSTTTRSQRNQATLSMTQAGNMSQEIEELLIQITTTQVMDMAHQGEKKFIITITIMTTRTLPDPTATATVTTSTTIFLQSTEHSS